MKICIVGKNSKIAKVIEKSVISKSNTIMKVSQRNDDKIKLPENINTIIYLVSNTSTTPECKAYDEYLYSNCTLLINFILNNEVILKNKNFIYFSSAKIYNIFPHQNDYKEEKIENVMEYEQLKIIAQKMIELTRKCCEHDKLITKINTDILPLMLKLPSINNYYPIYEYTKAISEIVIKYLLHNAYILRPTYLYGENNDNNIIYEMVYNSFHNKKVSLNNTEKDFVSYSTLIEILNKIIYSKNKNMNVINISSHINTKNDKLVEFINAISELTNYNIHIDFISKCPKEYTVNNNKMIEIIADKYVKDILEDNIRKIIYKQYIENIEQLTILQEYIGGSYARTYLVKDNDKKYILKISLGNGANNGCEKLKNEAKQMKAIYDIFSDKQNNCMPKIYDIKMTSSITIIKEEYIEGKTISDYIYDEQPNIKLIEDYISQVCNIIFSAYSRTIPQKVNILEKGINRAKDRLTMVYNTKFISDLFKNALDFETITINDKKYENPIKLLEMIYLKKKNNFETNLGVCISGDIILDNVIIKDENLYIVDTRGEDLFWIDGKPYFEPYYDCGKMLFYFYGWKSIREEKINMTTNNYNLLNTCSYIDITDTKINLLYQLAEQTENEFIKYKKYINNEETEEEFRNKIKLMAGIHFLSDTYPRIMGKGNKLLECFSEFLIGTIIINDVYKKMLGE